MSARSLSLPILASSIALASCNTPTPVDRAAVYGEIATNVIAPSYADLRTKTADLASASTAYCADATNAGSFAALRSALDAAHVAYSRTNAFEVSSSPVVTMLAPTLLDGFPVDTAAIDLLLGGAGAIDFATQPANVQGFYAAEYLLDSAGDPATDQARFTDPVSGARRCEVLVAVAARIASVADAAADVWDPPSTTTFGAQLATAGHPGSVYPTVGTASTDLCMTIHNLARDLADERIGRPLGILAMGPTAPDATLVPGRHANWTKADLLAGLDSIENFYLGRYGDVDGRGMEDIIVSRAPARDREMKDQLAAARAAIEAIPGAIDDTIASNPGAPELVAAFDALKSLQSLIALGIGPTIAVFSSAFESDGD